MILLLRPILLLPFNKMLKPMQPQLPTHKLLLKPKLLHKLLPPLIWLLLPILLLLRNNKLKPLPQLLHRLKLLLKLKQL